MMLEVDHGGTGQTQSAASDFSGYVQLSKELNTTVAVTYYST